MGHGELFFNQPAVSVRCVRAALLERDTSIAADMTWSYDPADAIAGVTYPSVTGGIQTTITRNERGMLMRQNTTSAGLLAPPIFDQRIDYKYDELIDKTWSQSGTESQLSFPYYDGAHRLLKEALHNNGNLVYSSDLTYDRIGNRRTELRNGIPPFALYAYPPLPPGDQQPRHMNALMSITAGQDSDARTYTSDGALATRAVMRTSASGTTQRLEAWGYSALSLPEWYSLRSDAAVAGSTCTPDATLAPQHIWRYRYGPQQEREQKREWENGSATQPLHWTYWLLGADGKQLATYHGVQGATCGGPATDVALWPVEYAAYAPLGTRVITRSNGTKEIVLADHLGSSRVVLSQQGYIAQSTAYTAYGEISHSEGDGARTGYIGRFAEPEGSFNLHGVCFYDPDAGSFTAVDPLWSKYAAWTPYQYAQAEPMRRVDWSGLNDFLVSRNGEVEMRVTNENVDRVIVTSRTGEESIITQPAGTLQLDVIDPNLETSDRLTVLSGFIESTFSTVFETLASSMYTDVEWERMRLIQNAREWNVITTSHYRDRGDGLAYFTAERIPALEHVHNHPSGITTASGNDLLLLSRVRSNNPSLEAYIYTESGGYFEITIPDASR